MDILGKFGFTLMNSREVSLDEGFDSAAIRSLVEKEPSIQKCISCGGCSATCTTSSSGTNLRKAILLWNRGLVDQAKDVAKHCLFCSKCRFVCPRGVNGRNILAIIHQN